MYPHQQETVARVVAHFETQPEVRALLLGGSIAHGFAAPSSDVDIMIVVDADEHAARFRAGRLQFYSAELATYAGGYVDGKYIGEQFLDAVAERGSDPARFAFADARILISHIPDLTARLERIVRFPVEEKAARIERFYAQLQAWKWYAGEAAKRDNPYLMNVAVSKLVLFGGRLILAHNELLYPFHKWFLAVLERAPDKPDGLVEAMLRASRAPSLETATELYTMVDEFRAWEGDARNWPNHFMLDSELTWLHGAAAIDDM